MGSQEHNVLLGPVGSHVFSETLPSPDISSPDNRRESNGHIESNGHAIVSPRRSSLLTLTLSSVIAAGVQFGWALQLSLLTPYIQTLGIEHEFSSFIWLCGPITGLVVQPCVGVWSDKCTMRLGRRRPFILGGALLICVAVTIIGFSADIGYLLGDNLNDCEHHLVVKRPRAVGVFVMGFWLLDLANNTVQGPARALLADLAGSEQRDTANSIFCLWMAVGNIMGFSTGASGNWHKVFPRVMTKACCEKACGNLKAAFLVAVVFLFMCTLVTVFFAKEIPLVRVKRRMEDVSPLLLDQPEMLVEMQGVNLSTETENYRHNNAHGRADFQQAADNKEGESADTGPSSVLVNLLTSIRHLPLEMKSVLAVMALCWLSWFPFFLFDTDWMGREVFQGDPFGGEAKKDAYELGVQRGTFGLLLNSIVLAVGSFFIDPLCRWIGPKLVWSISNFMISFGMASTAIITVLAGPKGRTSNPILYADWAKNAAIAFFAMLGLPLAVTYSVPYSITAELASDSGGGQGVAMGVLNLAVVLPQMVVALGAGPFDSLFGGGNEPAFGFAALFAFAAGLVAWFKLPHLSHGGYTAAGGGHGFG